MGDKNVQGNWEMKREDMMSYILESIPYPILFVDVNHIIRYMNKHAKFHYYEERGYRDLIGKSLFDCHNPHSKEKVLAAFERLKHHGNEFFVGVSMKNHRIYMNPVRNENGELVGYFERFELNLQK
jgi:DUF438 domain-containing protein